MTSEVVVHNVLSYLFFSYNFFLTMSRIKKFGDVINGLV